MNRIFAVAICALTLLNVGCAQSQKSSEKNTASYSWPEEQWDTSSPEAEGIDPVMLNRFVEQLKSDKYGRVNHFILIRNGRIVVDEKIKRDYTAIAANVSPEETIGLNTRNPIFGYEDAYYHPYYKGSDLHSLQSVTKSVTSIALGIAIDAGHIQGVNAPVSPYFEAYEFDKSDSRRASMTIKDLLTMQSGIEWQTEGDYQDPLNSTVALENADNWIQLILNHPMEREPGKFFEYNDGVSVLLGKIVREATGQRLDKWAEEHLFDPIGIESYYWKITPDGEVDSMGGLYLSAHDLARVGLLMLRNGKWKDKRVVSQSWVRQSTERHVIDRAPDDDESNAGYGYQWWLPNPVTADTVAFSAFGFGGQRLTVIPALDLVIVFNGWDLHVDYGAPERALRTEVLPDAVRR
ncbi:beta-lactamase [Paraglaciecola polaris LMG 21857]|uniref:Beta-lactamase n=2 Tax=Paraglaciecola polaris TaxID=222814 RepID=K6Z858_9ALTE|nr:beta-lactamase [Paraglaciecola polaris LMG 21857]|tara:strand:+ start:53913 stop:55133 length:1221 start_codon:yes stop_codon:yes gene_type:complete